ncbi:hypothetical protein C8A01DRAFT_15470 [Parachaetomium inaequale]|uniref:Uncharacterized protein n=1 Tax=Parachaetomium inaequale TaxID=2588326 RepID=A0AAN6PHD6_9PEZI|nr:hypothetical protein C8A01DRAFT_15470 [Parachaetomium inaequale]
MPSSLLVLAALMGTALALPSPITAADPVRILPYNWLFNITALKGPGCPDFGQVSPPFSTRPTFGMNTVDGSEIYYWHFAYPHIRLSVGPETPEASVWCETTLSYAELENSDGLVPAVEPEYRLKLHKNGTRMLANYELDEGVEARWKFTYATNGHDKIVDNITVAGPREAGSYSDNSPQRELVQWRLPKCGTGTIKYRTELTLKASKAGAKGSVSSEKTQWEGETGFYGVQQGVSYDWEKCAA